MSRVVLLLLSPRSRARAKAKVWLLLLLRGHPILTGNGARGTRERSRRVGGWRADTAARSSLATAGLARFAAAVVVPQLCACECAWLRWRWQWLLGGAADSSSSRCGSLVRESSRKALVLDDISQAVLRKGLVCRECRRARGVMATRQSCLLATRRRLLSLALSHLCEVHSTDPNQIRRPSQLRPLPSALCCCPPPGSCQLQVRLSRSLESPALRLPKSYS